MLCSINKIYIPGSVWMWTLCQNSLHYVAHCGSAFIKGYKIKEPPKVMADRSAAHQDPSCSRISGYSTWDCLPREACMQYKLTSSHRKGCCWTIGATNGWLFRLTLGLWALTTSSCRSLRIRSILFDSGPWHCTWTCRLKSCRQGKSFIQMQSMKPFGRKTVYLCAVIDIETGTCRSTAVCWKACVVLCVI